MQDVLLRFRRSGDSSLVSVIVRNETGEIIGEVTDNEWHTVSVRSYDRNFDRTSFELRDTHVVMWCSKSGYCPIG